MATRTFRAQDMLTALREIQKEMGPEAVVVSMREIPRGPAWQVWNKPGVEVVATGDIPPQSPRITEMREQSDAPGRKEIESILLALVEKKGFSSTLPRKIEFTQAEEPEWARAGRGEMTPWKPPVLKRPKVEEKFSAEDFIQLPEDKTDEGEMSVEQGGERGDGLLTLYQYRLQKQGVDQMTMEKIIEMNRSALSEALLNNPVRLEKFLKSQLEVLIKSGQSNIGFLPGKVMALIGGTGSGKTSTCAKLAAFYSATMGKKVAWISADTVRTAAITEAATYGEILNIPVTFVYTPQELASAMDEYRSCDLILVDTPGVNSMNEDQVLELSTILTLLPPRSVYLVASATMKDSDLYQAALTFAPFKPRGLIMTKVDETGSYGSLFNLAVRSKLPMMYMTNGSNVLGNLHPGEPSALINLLFDGGLR